MIEATVQERGGQHARWRPFGTALHMAQRKYPGQPRVVRRTQCAPFAQTRVVVEQCAAAQCVFEGDIVHRQVRQIRDALRFRHGAQLCLARRAQLGVGGLLQVTGMCIGLQRAQAGVHVIVHGALDQAVVLALVAHVDRHIDQHQQQRHPGDVLARPGFVQRHDQHDNVRVREWRKASLCGGRCASTSCALASRARRSNLPAP